MNILLDMCQEEEEGEEGEEEGEEEEEEEEEDGGWRIKNKRCDER